MMTNTVLNRRTLGSPLFSPVAAAHTATRVPGAGAHWLGVDARKPRDQRRDVTPRAASLWITPWTLTPMSDQGQLEQMRADVTRRLQRVCADMSPQQFATLVNDICARKLRWAEDASPSR